MFASGIFVCGNLSCKFKLLKIHIGVIYATVAPEQTVATRLFLTTTTNLYSLLCSKKRLSLSLNNLRPDVSK